MNAHAVARLRVSALSAVLALTMGCAATGGPDSLAPRVAIEQLPGSEFVVQRGRAISVAFRVSVQNPRAQAVRLVGIELKTDTRSPYEFENVEPLAFDVTIEPGAQEFVEFDTWVVPREQRRGNMVHLTGTAHLESETGRLRVEFWHRFHEPD